MRRPAAPRLLRGLLRLSSDRRGVSALEFALIAPVLVVMLFGMDELSSAIMAQRRVGHAASETGDLVSQYQTITPANASDADDAAGWVIAPFPSTSTGGGPTTLLYQQRITSIMVDSTTSHTPRVNWSCAPSGQSGLTAYAAGTAMTSLPKDANGNYILLSTTAGDSVVMSEATYAYTSPLQYIIKNAINFSNTFYFKPRESNQVVLQIGGSTSSSTSAWSSTSATVAYSYSSPNAAPSLSCNYQTN